jgi:hypothetical protein
MKSAGTKELVAAVEHATGYKVVVDTIENISEDAQMVQPPPPFALASIGRAVARAVQDSERASEPVKN